MSLHQSIVYLAFLGFAAWIAQPAEAIVNSNLSR